MVTEDGLWFQLSITNWHPSILKICIAPKKSHIFKGVNIQLKNGDFSPTVVLYHSEVCQSLVLLTPNGL